MKLVLIPAGKFTMGSPESEQLEAAREEADVTSVTPEEARKRFFANEGPMHEVTITKAFYMGIYDVTQEEYGAVMGKNPSIHKGARYPVEDVSWNDAMEFCRKLSATTGKIVGLPTEAQWEYACRAGTQTPFYTGKTLGTNEANYDGDAVYDSRVNRPRQGLRTTTQVGSFKSNAFGLFDMHGNVSQWCSDWFDESYYSNSPSSDPPGPPGKTNERVTRGGGNCDRPSSCRSANRGKEVDYIGNSELGFRVAVAVGAD
jgi:formylglycine-generating enzyme required for sulfatase activity